MTHAAGIRQEGLADLRRRGYIVYGEPVRCRECGGRYYTLHRVGLCMQCHVEETRPVTHQRDRISIGALEDYGLSERAIMSLEKAKILYLDQLEGMRDYQFLAIKNLGKRHLRALQVALRNYASGRYPNDGDQLQGPASGDDFRGISF